MEKFPVELINQLLYSVILYKADLDPDRTSEKADLGPYTKIYLLKTPF